MTRARSAAAPSGPAYSIRVVSRMTSIEPETLRMWERRYGFPTPSRTEGGARVYSESDVTALNLIVVAIIPGQQIGPEGLFASAVAAVLFALFGLFEKFKPL